MTTDWRALCEELISALADFTPLNNRELAALDRARAALAQPEPERYCQMIVDVQALAKRWNLPVPWLAKLVSEVLAEAAGIEGLKKPSIPPALPDFEARAALAAEAAPPAEGEQHHPAPVPVAERLPGPEDLNDKGECWEWDPASDAWVLIRPIGLTFRTGPWLPATALPLPATEAQP